MSAHKQKRYSDSELQEFEALLLEKLDSAHKELDAIQQVLGGKDSNSTQRNIKLFEDNADIVEEERLSQSASRQRKFIKELEAALVRIKNGTYGICIVTGELIDKNRLKVVPHTRHSLAAKLSGRAESK